MNEISWIVLQYHKLSIYGLYVIISTVIVDINTIRNVNEPQEELKHMLSYFQYFDFSVLLLEGGVVLHQTLMLDLQAYQVSLRLHSSVLNL